jgi:hypothetical protein
VGIFRELLQLRNDGLDDKGSSLFVVLNGVLEDDYDRLSGRDSEVDIRRIEQRLEDGQLVLEVVERSRVRQLRQQERPENVFEEIFVNSSSASILSSFKKGIIWFC